MKINSVESNSLYHSAIVEPTIILGEEKELLKLKQLGKLSGVRCLHGTQYSAPAG